MKLLPILALALTPALFAQSSDGKLRIIAFGAHPGDTDDRSGGLAAKYAALGHHVKFVSVTNGDAGSPDQGGGMLSMRRRKEAQEAGRRIGVEYEVLENRDGELLPTIDARMQIIRKIREWKADIVISLRPFEAHPDLRYTGMLVQDAAYMVVVPNVCPDTPPLKTNPVFLYFQDRFQRPAPFRPDIVVSIDDVAEKKISMLDAHVSQMYEFTPWLNGTLNLVPRDAKARLDWLRVQRLRPAPETLRPALNKWYGSQASSVRYAEAFELCEYGRQPTEAELRKLFPFFPSR